MKNTLFALFLLTFTGLLAQEKKELIGTWSFSKVTTTSPSCKGVDYFPIQSFTFKADKTAEFRSEGVLAKAKYSWSGDYLVLTDLVENGVKQDSSGRFLVKRLDASTLVLSVTYECGSIDIFFKKAK